jgi:hypothetical protein
MKLADDREAADSERLGAGRLATESSADSGQDGRRPRVSLSRSQLMFRQIRQSCSYQMWSWPRIDI